MFGFNRLFKNEPVVQEPPKGDVAWSEESSIYTRNNFEKYNPDALIGVKGFSIYRKMMLDEQVKAVVRFKRDAVTSKDYFFELDYEKAGLTQKEAEFRIGLSYEVISQLQGSFKDSLNGIMSGSYNGFSLTEKLFGFIEYEGRSYYGIEKLKLKPFDTFTFAVDEYSNTLDLIQKLGSKEQHLDINKFIHFVVNPDYDEHYGGSELREAYRAWFSKDNVIKFWNIWLERSAGGFRYIQPKEGKTLQPGTTEYSQLQTVLSSIQTATGMILPSSVEMKSEYPSNNIAYKEAIESYDLSISRAMLVPNLVGITPAGQTGSYSQSDTQLEAFMWTLDADTARLEEVLNEQLFRQLAEYNFGDGIYPKFKFKPSSTKKLHETINTWKDLVSAGAARATESDELHIRTLLEFPEPTEELPSKNPTDALPASNEGAGDGTDNQPKPDDNTDNTDVVANNEDSNPNTNESTIVGKGIVSVAAFDRALKRVDFAVIGAKSEDSVDVYTAKLGRTMGKMYDEAIVRLKTENADSETEQLKAVKDFKFKTSLVTRVRKDVNLFLKAGWDLGQRHAQTEIDKAKNEEFKKVNFKRLKFISEDYFATKAFDTAGNLTNQALAIFDNNILNGVKGGKTVDQVINQIYKDLASAGMLSMEDAKDALGQALGVDNPDARMRTIVRTNSFEAINEARYSYFTDASLGGFVEALEYSAILDSRTTSICQHLDGQIHDANSDVWSEYRPPNHFNCRSLLVPVTQKDEWVESDEPTQQPQKGFV